MPEDQLLSRDDKVALKRALLAGQRDSLPPVVTHNLVDDKRDEVRGDLVAALCSWRSGGPIARVGSPRCMFDARGRSAVQRVCSVCVMKGLMNSMATR